MRNFASYDVDVRRRTSGVVKTVCNKCQATRHNKRDRSLRVNVDTGHCHCYHCGADFYVPDEAEEREKAEQRAARQRRAAAVPPSFPASGVRSGTDYAFRICRTLAGGDTLHPAGRHRRTAHHGTGGIHAAIRSEGALRLLQLFRGRTTGQHEIP